MSDVLAQADDIVRLALPDPDDSHPLDWFDDSAPGDPLLPGVLTETSYTLPEGLNLGQWLKIGENLQRMERSVQWWLGDWWRYGERKYGDMASRAAREAIKDTTGHSYETVRHAGLVASKFESGRRRPDLPFTHHAEVASLPEPHAEMMLDRARDERLSTRVVREQVRQVQREIRAAELKPEPDLSRVPPTVRIEVADARAMPLDRDTVHLIVTSPPYALDVQYEGGDVHPAAWDAFMTRWLMDALRVTAPGGRLALNIPLDTTLGGYRSTYATAAAAAQRVGWNYRATIVWRDNTITKTTARGSIDSASSPHIIARVEMVALFSKGDWGRASDIPSDLTRDEWVSWTDGVWEFPGESNAWEGHPAAFPIRLPRQLIKLLSFPGDVVLDPFVGSGTTVLAALQLGRQSIGFDRSQVYVDSALRRVAAQAGRGSGPGAVGETSPGASLSVSSPPEVQPGGLRGWLDSGAGGVEGEERLRARRAGLTVASEEV